MSNTKHKQKEYRILEFPYFPPSLWQLLKTWSDYVQSYCFSWERRI